MPFYNVRERDSRELAPGINARTFWGDQMLCAVVELDAGAVLSHHSHVHEQAGIVLDGELELTIEEETRRLQPGDLYIIPSGVAHHARAGSRPTRVLDIFSPVRTEYQY